MVAATPEEHSAGAAGGGNATHALSGETVCRVPGRRLRTVAAQESPEIAVVAVKVLGCLAADDSSVCEAVGAGLLSVLRGLLEKEQLKGTRGASLDVVVVVRSVGAALLALVTRAGAPTPLS